MEYLPALVTLGFVQLLAVMSPGQSFVVVSRQTLANSRSHGFATALGMGVGSVVWALAAMAGVALVLQKAAWLYGLLKLLGAGYLIYLAVMVWRHASESPETVSADGPGSTLPRAFIVGLMTQLANPKVIVFFGSIFFTVLPSESPVWVYVAVLAIVFCNETVWYALVAMFFSFGPTQRAYLRIKGSVDRMMAVVLGALGLGLAADTLQDMLPTP